MEETYKVIVHLIDGTRLKCSAPTSATDLMEVYRALGAKDSRIKLPTRKNKM